ncbi:hypothetical protein NQ318_008538 [Aromia moschata]|uniref:Uncharacterized protein n=1 Tax=Aromia moschata TaxID=1265417 RepID=A0AAV8YVS0_9CUCU|nr:hypothetical protein NQ318_008538 [Aromia moschata]
MITVGVSERFVEALNVWGPRGFRPGCPAVHPALTMGEKRKKQKLKDIHFACQDDPTTHDDEEKLRKLSENLDDPKTGAHMLCMTVKAGLQRENGQLDREVIRSKVALVTHDQATVDGLVEKCAVNQESAERTAVKLILCFVENNIHYYYLVLIGWRFEELKGLIVRLFQEKYPELPQISQGTVSTIWKQIRERGHVLQLKRNPPKKLSDDQKLDAHALITEDDKQRFKTLYSECQSDTVTKIADDVLERISRREHVHRDVFQVHHLCMSKKLGFQNETGQVDKEGVRKVLALGVVEEGILNKIVDKCAVQRDTPEETAEKLMKCFHKHVGRHVREHGGHTRGRCHGGRRHGCHHGNVLLPVEVTGNRHYHGHGYDSVEEDESD